MGDYNQDITSKQIKEFFEKLHARDIHQSFNIISEEQLDRTYVKILQKDQNY